MFFQLLAKTSEIVCHKHSGGGGVAETSGESSINAYQYEYHSHYFHHCVSARDILKHIHLTGRSMAFNLKMQRLPHHLHQAGFTNGRGTIHRSR